MGCRIHVVYSTSVSVSPAINGLLLIIMGIFKVKCINVMKNA